MTDIAPYSDKESCVAARLYWSSSTSTCYISYDVARDYLYGTDIINPQGSTFYEYGIYSPLGRESYIDVEDIDDTESIYNYTNGLAGEVLTAYDIPYRVVGNVTSGDLQKIDIASVDAWAVIKSSLLEAFAVNRYEATVELNVNSEDGVVEIYEVGSFSANITDIYHVIQGASYKIKLAGALVTGKKPTPYRRISNSLDMLADSKIYNLTYNKHQCIYADEFDIDASIVYKDPTFVYDELVSVPPGWSRVAAVIHNFEGPNDEDIQVSFDKSSLVPVFLGDGVAAPIKMIPSIADEDLLRCLYTKVDYTDNFLMVEPPEDLYVTNTRNGKNLTFLSVDSLVIIGEEWAGKETPTSCTAAEEGSDDGFCSMFPSRRRSAYTLSKGQHYATINELEGARLVLLVAAPGQLTYGYDTSYVNRKLEAIENGDIYPLGGGKYVKVDEMYAMVNLSLPSINVFAPFTGAIDAANKIKYRVSRLLIYEEPAPIAINGRLIDMTDMQPRAVLSQLADYVTNYDREIQALDNGRSFQVTLASIDSETCKYLSGKLFDLLSNDDGVRTTYICGPYCKPKIGGIGPGGGIINSISYKYQDSASYTISVNEGPILEEGQVSGISGEKILQTKDVSVEGTVISRPVGGKATVYVDNFGTYSALITTPDSIAVGDKVSVTIHNYATQRL